MKLYHLTPSEGIWTLTQEGCRKVLAEYESKSAALSGSARFMIDEESTLKVHRPDGTVAEERTARPRIIYRRDSEETAPWEEEPMPGMAPYTFK